MHMDATNPRIVHSLFASWLHQNVESLFQFFANHPEPTQEDINKFKKTSNNTMLLLEDPVGSKKQFIEQVWAIITGQQRANESVLALIPHYEDGIYVIDDENDW